METTVTVPPTFSFNCKAASIPALSSGFIILGTPSLMSVFVFGSSFTSVVSGTCFAQTTIFIVFLLPHIYIIKFKENHSYCRNYVRLFTNLHMTGNNHLLNFTCSFINFYDLSISHHSFNMVLSHVTISTE